MGGFFYCPLGASRVDLASSRIVISQVGVVRGQESGATAGVSDLAVAWREGNNPPTFSPVANGICSW